MQSGVRIFTGIHMCNTDVHHVCMLTHAQTGSAAVQWFLTNMENITTVQQAQVCSIQSCSSYFVLQFLQDVGQRLMDLKVFIGIQGSSDYITLQCVGIKSSCTHAGSTIFVISESAYYQFTDIASSR